MIFVRQEPGGIIVINKYNMGVKVVKKKVNEKKAARKAHRAGEISKTAKKSIVKEEKGMAKDGRVAKRTAHKTARKENKVAKLEAKKTKVRAKGKKAVAAGKTGVVSRARDLKIREMALQKRIDKKKSK